MFAFDHIEATNAAADVYADPFFDLRGHLETGRLQSEFAGGDRKVNEAPHFFHFFFFNILEGIEALNFAGDLSGEIGGVERCDAAYAALPFRDCLPSLLSPHADRGDQADPGDNNPSQTGLLSGRG